MGGIFENYEERNFKFGHKIIGDIPKEGSLAVDFDNYVNSISNIILSSKPPYTIGIYGGWGTGKSTLITNVMKEIKEQKCEYVDFNAWRFERESSHATIPLLLTIITKLLTLLESENSSLLEDSASYNEVAGDTITHKKTTLRKKILRVLSGLSLDFQVGIPGFGGLGVNYDVSKAMESEKTSWFKKKQSVGKRDISEFRKTTFQEGIELIEEILGSIKSKNNNEDLKLVVFIDDLDRCTPDKAVEVFESTKVFLNIEHVVFVLGLSQEIVQAAITKKYKEFEEDNIFSGVDYLKKIIQLQIVIPPWHNADIINFIEHFLTEYDDILFKPIFQKNVELIAAAGENNPREIIRLLNNFIFTYQVYSKKNIEAETLLAVQALRLRWPKEYEEILRNPKVLDKFKKGLYDRKRK